MSLKKIFFTLITVVLCVMAGAFILNIMFPNVVTTLVNASEDMVFKGTGLSFDFNNDSNAGSNDKSYKGDQNGKITTKPSTGF